MDDPPASRPRYFGAAASDSASTSGRGATFDSSAWPYGAASSDRGKSGVGKRVPVSGLREGSTSSEAGIITHLGMGKRGPWI